MTVILRIILDFCHTVNCSQTYRGYLTSSGCKPNSGKSVYHLHNRCSEISVKSPKNLALSNKSFYLYGLLLKTLDLTIISTNIHYPAIPLALSSLSKTDGRQIAESMYIFPVTTVPQTLHIHRSNINAMYRQMTA